jgi:hypothetical protein
LKYHFVSSALNILPAQESQLPFALYPKILYDGPLEKTHSGSSLIAGIERISIAIYDRFG